MPNHISNRLVFSGDSNIIKTLLNFIKTDHPESQRISLFGDLMFTKDGKDGYLSLTRKTFMVYENRICIEKIENVTSVQDGWNSVIEPAWTNYIDFNNIIPAPKCVFQGDLGREDEEKNPNRNWMKFNVECWGTKWNSYSTRINKNGKLFFQTAWSYPKPVIERLSWLFPEISMKLDSSCEGGCFCGTCVFKGGKIVEGDIKRVFTTAEYKKVKDVFRKR